MRVFRVLEVHETGGEQGSHADTRCKRHHDRVKSRAGSYAAGARALRRCVAPEPDDTPDARRSRGLHRSSGHRQVAGPRFPRRRSGRIRRLPRFERHAPYNEGTYAVQGFQRSSSIFPVANDKDHRPARVSVGIIHGQRRQPSNRPCSRALRSAMSASGDVGTFGGASTPGLHMQRAGTARRYLMFTRNEARQSTSSRRAIQRTRFFADEMLGGWCLTHRGRLPAGSRTPIPMRPRKALTQPTDYHRRGLVVIRASQGPMRQVGDASKRTADLRSVELDAATTPKHVEAPDLLRQDSSKRQRRQRCRDRKSRPHRSRLR